MGGMDWVYSDFYGRLIRKDLASVDILDTSNHTVTAGPSMNNPRLFCASAVIGNRIFVLGGSNKENDESEGEDEELDSVEYWDFAKPCDKDETKEGSWTIHSELVLSFPSTLHGAAVALGSCLMVVGMHSINVGPILQVLDTTTHRNRVWNLPPLGDGRAFCSLVGSRNPSCATLPLVDKNSWCFCRLLEQPQRIMDQYRVGLVSQRNHNKRARLIAGPGSISSTGH